MSLKSDLRDPASPVGGWARARFASPSGLYPLLRDAPAPVVRPAGWGDGHDQRWSWSGTAVGHLLGWQLGSTTPSTWVQRGVDVVIGGPSDELPLDRLVAQPPSLADLTYAARVAVIWALAENHVRYPGTDNPLTGNGELDVKGLLELAPDDVVADVAAIAELAADRLVARILAYGSVTVGPEYRYNRSTADADLVAGTTLLETKTTVRLRPKLVDVLQPLLYSLLHPEPIDRIGWILPRAGAIVAVDLGQALQAAGCTDRPSVLQAELSELTR